MTFFSQCWPHGWSDTDELGLELGAGNQEMWKWGVNREDGRLDGEAGLQAQIPAPPQALTVYLKGN